MDYFRELEFVSVVHGHASCAHRLLWDWSGTQAPSAGRRTYMLRMERPDTAASVNTKYIMVTTKWASIASEIGLRTDVPFWRTGHQRRRLPGCRYDPVTGRREVKGLTTAAGFASACMGLAIGAGFYECVFLGTVLIFLSMRYLPIVENMMVEHARF